MKLSDSPSIRAMTVSSGSNTSSVTGDAVVVLVEVDVLPLVRRLLVGELEVGPPTVAGLDIVIAEVVFESPSLSVAGMRDVSLLPVVGLSVPPSVITEVPVSDEYLVEIVVSVDVFTALVGELSSVRGSVLLLGEV